MGVYCRMTDLDKRIYVDSKTHQAVERIKADNKECRSHNDVIILLITEYEEKYNVQYRDKEKLS